MEHTKTIGTEQTNIPNIPEKKFAAGAVSATVWQNSGRSAKGDVLTYRSVSFQRRYKDRDGNWKTSASLRVNDLPRASIVLQKAYEYIVLNGGREHNDYVVAEEAI